MYTISRIQKELVLEQRKLNKVQKNLRFDIKIIKV
jgi:hypothetical protein